MLQLASATIWRGARWFARWMPFAFLACFSAAATLYLARFAREIEHAEHWGLLFIGLSAVAAIGAVRRARGLPMWDAFPRRRERLLLAHASAVFAGLLTLELAALAMQLVHRGWDWLPWVPIFALRTLPPLALVSSVALVLMAMLFAAVAYLSRASGVPGLMLTSILGAGLGALHGARMLLGFAPVPAGWPYGAEIIGAFIGLMMGFTFWIMDGVAVVATLEPGRARSTLPVSSWKISPAAWGGFLRVISLTIATPLPIVMLSPSPYLYPLVLIIFDEAPSLGIALVLLFIICVGTARVTKPSYYREGDAYLRGKRVGICTIVLFINIVWALWSWGLLAVAIGALGHR